MRKLHRTTRIATYQLHIQPRWKFEPFIIRHVALLACCCFFFYYQCKFYLDKVAWDMGGGTHCHISLCVSVALRMEVAIFKKPMEAFGVPYAGAQDTARANRVHHLRQRPECCPHCSRCIEPPGSQFSPFPAHMPMHS